MIIDQDEINELLNNAADLTEEAATAIAAPPPAAVPAVLCGGSVPADVQRTLRLRVPVIVRLAQRVMPIRDVMKLSPGAIIEFEKSGDSDLDLMINNRAIGFGSAVKVGEKFGLRVQSIGNLGERIRSMGV